ncbi:MAG: hypothetical protein Q9163_004292 [Psora crenata]
MHTLSLWTIGIFLLTQACQLASSSPAPPTKSDPSNSSSRHQEDAPISYHVPDSNTTITFRQLFDVLETADAHTLLERARNVALTRILSGTGSRPISRGAYYSTYNNLMLNVFEDPWQPGSSMTNLVFSDVVNGLDEYMCRERGVYSRAVFLVDTVLEEGGNATRMGGGLLTINPVAAADMIRGNVLNKVAASAFRQANADES